MISPIVSKSAGMANSATRYLPLQNQYLNGVTSAEANASTPMAASGTLSNFYFLAGNAPGVGKNYTLTVYKNGVATAMTITVADSATSGSDTVNTVSYVAGDTLSIQSVPSGTPATPTPTYSFTMDQTGQTVIGGDVIGSLSASVSAYYPLQVTAAVSTTAPTTGSVIPTAGTISNLYFKINGTPGTARSYTATLVVNGTDTALTCQISGSNTTANDTTHSVSVSAGDYVWWRIDPSGTPTVRIGSLGCLFTPTVDGESIHTYMNQTASVWPASGGAIYLGIGGNGNNGTEAGRVGSIGGVWTAKKLFVRVDTAPGSGKSWTNRIRVGGANSGVEAVISDTATTASDTSNSAATALNDLVGVSVTQSGTPAAASTGGWGFVLDSNSVATTTSTSSTSSSISTSSTSSSISTSTSRSTSTSSTSSSISTSSTSASTSVSISTSSTSASTSVSISTSSTSRSVSTSSTSSSTSISASTSSTSSSISISTSSTSQSTSTSLSTSSTSSSISISTSTTTAPPTTTSTSSTSTSTTSTSTSSSTSTTMLDISMQPRISIRHDPAPSVRIRWRLS